VQNTTVLNRDVNACRNFATIFLSIIAGHGRPPRFSPGNAANPNAAAPAAPAAPAATNPNAAPNPNPNVDDPVDPNVEENDVAFDHNDPHQ